MRRVGMAAIGLALAALAAPPMAARPTARAAHAAFPYLRWPASLAPQGGPTEQATGHFRFWDGSALQDVEGRTMLVALAPAGAAAFDGAALHAAWDRRLTALGAKRIATGLIPPATLATINDADKTALAPGLGDAGHTPVSVWTLRRPGRQVWFQYGVGDARANLAVVEARLN